MTDDHVVRASKLDTTAISDALDRLGIAGQCLNIKPLDHRFRMTGRAFTILYGPAGTPPGTVGDYVDDVAAGSVVVLDNGGRENATVWADIHCASPRDRRHRHRRRLPRHAPLARTGLPDGPGTSGPGATRSAERSRSA